MANDQPLPVLQVLPPACSAPDDQSHYFRPSPKECILLLLHKFLGNKPLPQSSSIFSDRDPYDPDALPDIFRSAEQREHGVYLFTKLSKKGKLINSNKNASRVVPGKGSWHCSQTANVTHHGTKIGTVRTLGYREKGSVNDHRFQIHEYSLPENTRLCYNPLRDYVLCHLSVNDRWCNGKKISKAKKTYCSNNNNNNNSPTSSTVTYDHDHVPEILSTSADHHHAIEYNQVSISRPWLAPAAIGYDPTLSTSAPAIEYNQEPTLSTSAPAIEYNQVPTTSTLAPAAIEYVPTLSTSAPAVEYNQVPTTSTLAPAVIEYDPTLSTSAPAIEYNQVPTTSTLAPAAIEYDHHQVPTLSTSAPAIEYDHDPATAFPDDNIIFVDDDFEITEAMLREVDGYFQDYTPEDDFLSDLRADSLIYHSSLLKP